MIFFEALDDKSLEKMKVLPKSDLHSHAGRGGKISYIEKYANVTIPPFSGVFSSLNEMNRWLTKNINCYLPAGLDNYIKRVEASFVAAEEDNVVNLALDFGLGEINAFGGMEKFVYIIDRLNKTYAPNTKLLPVLAIYDYAELESLNEIFAYNWFDAIDIINYEGVLTMNVMKVVCRYAKKCGLKLKAHIGEYGSAEDVLRYAEELELDEIQHGIRAVDSTLILKYLANKKIVFNVCPTSNVMLGLCNGYSSHPIREMYNSGLKITINTDDLMIFNSTVSDEYIRLFHNYVLDKQALFDIYINGLLN